jgi:hypothetical protein
MVSSGWHSVAVSIVLAVAHSLSIGLLYLLARRLFAHLPGRDRTILSILATALGASTAVYWETVGSSFLDPLLVPPMLAGLLLLLDESPRAARRALAAGALFGAAAALKYSNAIYALAALPLALAMPGLAGVAWVRACLAYMAGGAVTLAAMAGPWFALLMREFGNPVFPLMNGWFQSPYAPAVNMVSERFTPADFTAVLSFPFRPISGSQRCSPPRSPCPWLRQGETRRRRARCEATTGACSPFLPPAWCCGWLARRTPAMG